VAKAKRPPQTRKKLGGPRVAPDGPRQAKVDAVADLKARLGEVSTTILTEYRGMTVKELADLRTGLREAGADFKVFKNTLATIAVKDLDLVDLMPLLEGPTAFTFATGDPVLAAKRLADFAKKVPALVLKGGLLEGRVLSGAEVTALSTLDSREVMLAKVAGLFASPLQKVAYLFAAPLQQVGALFAQLKDKLPAGDPPATEAPAAEVPAESTPAEGAADEAPVAETTEAPATERTDASAETGSQATPENVEAPAQAEAGSTDETTPEA